MEHLNLLYLFVTLLTGVVSLGIVGSVYGRTRDTLIGYYLGFYAVFTLLVTSNVLVTYINMNLPESAILPIVKFFRSTVGRFGLVFTLPVFMDHLCQVLHAKTRMKIFGGLGLALAIANLVLEVAPDTVENPGDIVVDTIFMAAMLYTLIIGVWTLGKLREPVRERLLRKFLIVFGCFLPGLLLDTLLSEFFSVPVQIFPFLYCGLSLVLTHHFLTSYSAHPAARSRVPHFEPTHTPAHSNSSDTVGQEGDGDHSPEETLFAQYDLSPREQEVFRLLVQGNSNQQIGETLFISINTVKAHVKKIYTKCGVKSRYELMALLHDRPPSC